MEIIAEIGQNHNGDVGLAVDMIHAAKESGADVAKFQLYDAVKLFPRENNPWFDYNCKTELSRKNVELLAQECQRAGIEFMASVFDVERIGWLEAVGVKRHKIASRSILDAPLIAGLAATEKPLIVSLGMWNQAEFPSIPAPGGVEFLYCIAKYPAPPEDVRLSSIDFTKYAGFSDHTIGVAASIAALARGARIIEKHFTMDKSLYGPDHVCSSTPPEFAELNRFRKELRRLW